MSDLPWRLRSLKILDEVGSDNPLGCDAADLIESQAAEITAKQRIIDAQAGMIADLQERLRSETTELRMQALSDEGQHIEETGSLRIALKDLAILAEAWGLHSRELACALNLLKSDPDIAAILSDNTPGDGHKTMGDA